MCFIVLSTFNMTVFPTSSWGYVSYMYTSCLHDFKNKLYAMNTYIGNKKKVIINVIYDMYFLVYETQICNIFPIMIPWNCTKVANKVLCIKVAMLHLKHKLKVRSLRYIALFQTANERPNSKQVKRNCSREGDFFHMSQNNNYLC